MDENCPLRPASTADLDALAQLERVAFSDPWSRTQLEEALGWSGAVALVVDQPDNAIAGYVLGRVIVDEAEILSIATHPDRRRAGLGRALLLAVLAAMAERGARAVWLEVRDSNAPALALYRGEGFVAAGRRKGYYRRPVEDALILRKELRFSASSGTASS